MVNWEYGGTEIDDITQMPEGAFGFIYLITTRTGKRYLGKKQLLSVRKKKFGKREIAKMENKRLKKWKHVIKENDWKTYTGSNIDLNKLIEDGAIYRKEILYYAFSKQQLTYLELRELWTHRVLEDRNFFNGNIGGRFYNQYNKEE